jgi:hypothetical protein
VTAEWLQIWTMMTAGKAPFGISNDGVLYLALEPVLPHWLFVKEEKIIQVEGLGGSIMLPKNSFMFRLLGHCVVIYHNPARKNTYGPDSCRIQVMRITYNEGKEVTIEGYKLAGDIAQDVRDGFIQRIEVELR